MAPSHHQIADPKLPPTVRRRVAGNPAAPTSLTSLPCLATPSPPRYLASAFPSPSPSRRRRGLHAPEDPPGREIKIGPFVLLQLGHPRQPRQAGSDLAVLHRREAPLQPRQAGSDLSVLLWPAAACESRAAQPCWPGSLERRNQRPAVLPG